jgi:hypothetical protein
MATRFPIAVTVDRLVEFHGLADALCQQELGRLPSHASRDPVGEIIELMALRGQTGEQIQAWLHQQPEAVAHRSRPQLRTPLEPFPAESYDSELAVGDLDAGVGVATTFPVDVTVDRLVEFHGLADALCQEELGRLPSHTAGDPVAEIIELMALQGRTGEQIQAWLHEQPEAVAHRSKPQPQPRAPLPPFPPGSYDRELPWTPPQTRDFLRADAWGVTLPGAPFVPGGSSRHPERILSWFFDRFPGDWQKKILDQHARNGYTHFIQSAPDSMGPINNGPSSPPGNAQTLDQFVQTCLRIKRLVPYVIVFLGSKYFQPRDQSVAQWIAYLDPILNALIAADAADEFVPGWEWNLFNVPGSTTVQVFKHVGQKAHAAGKSCWLHFSPETTSWFADGDTRGRFGFYDDLGGDVDGLMYQTRPEWSIPETQARIVDTLTQFGRQPFGHKFRFHEDQAALMFDGDRPNEDDANLRGYLACCTRGLVPVYGYGNGARRPSGDVL